MTSAVDQEVSSLQGLAATKIEAEMAEIAQTSEGASQKDAYFTLSQPYDKEQFLALSKSVLKTALLLFAPLGMNHRLQGLFSGAEYVSEHGALFQHVVDIASRKLYVLQGIKESKIAATLNEYVERQNDAEVIKVAKGATEALEHVIKPPNVVELPWDADVQTTAAALRSVLGAWKCNHATLAAMQSVDETVQEVYKIDIPRTLPAFNDVSRCVTAEVVEGMHATSADLNLTHEQFVALVEVYGTTPEVLAVLQEFGFDHLQQAKQATLMALHPVAVFRDKILELICDRRSEGEDEGKDDEEVKAAKNALEAVQVTVTAQSDAVDSLRMGEVEDAAEHFRNAMPSEGVILPAMLLSQLHSNLAVSLMEMQSFEECIDEATKAVELNPNAYEAYRVRGKALLNIGDLTTAADDVMRGFLLSGAVDPSEAHMVEEIAREAVRANAKELYEQRTDRAHSFPQQWMMDSYFTSYKDLPKALGVPPINPNDSTTPLILSSGICSRDDDDSMALARKLAAVVYNVVNKHYEDSWTILQELKATYLRTENGQYDDTTEEALMSSEIAHHVLARLLNLLASFHYLSGDTPQALWALRVSSSLDTEFVDSIVKLAAVYGDLDEPEEALMLLEQAEMLERSRSDIFLHRAQILIMTGNVEDSIQELQRSRLLDEDNAMVWATLGLAYYKNDPANPHIARRTLRDASEKFPNNVEIFLYYGEIIAQMGDLTGAMEAFQTAAGLDPHCPLPYVNAARAYVAMNQHDVAMHHLKRALEIDPTVSSSHVDLGQTFLHGGKTDAAMAEFDVAVQKARYVPEYRDALSCKMVAEIQLKVEQELGIVRDHPMKE